LHKFTRVSIGRDEFSSLPVLNIHPPLESFSNHLKQNQAMQSKIITQISKLIFLFMCISCTPSAKIYDQIDLSTDYFKIHINQKGFITSMKNISVEPNQEFSPVDKPSPLMCLYDNKKEIYYEPDWARFNKVNKTLTLKYPNGSVARISIVPHEKYLKFTLQSLSPRDGVDDIQWGAYYTTINNLLGEIIGVARDTSDATNYAIGMLALNDNTLGGTSETIADAAPFQYIIHTPDSKRYPLPDNLHEGQVFSLGGNGISDVAFYAHKEPYYRIMYGNAATVDDKGRISITYHSRDRP